MKKWIIILVALILCTTLIFILFNKQNEEADDESKVENVETVKVSTSSMKSEVVVDGYIEDDIYTIDYNIIQGMVKDIYVHDGETVKCGDPLLRIDVRQNTGEIDVQIRQVKAAIAEVEVYLKHLRRDRKNLKNALKSIYLTDEEKETMKTQINTLSDQIEIYTTQVTGYDSQKYALYSTRDYITDNAKFVAPFNGTIKKMTMEKGQNIVPEQYIEIKKNTKPIAKVFVTENYLNFVKVDTAASVMLADGKTYSAKVKKIMEGGGESILYPIKIELDTENEIRNGLAVSAYFIEYENKKALTVPNKAIISFNSETYVYKVVGSKAVKTKVVLGISENDITEIKSGLSASDEVIIKGQFGIKDGQEVNCNVYNSES